MLFAPFLLIGQFRPGKALEDQAPAKDVGIKPVPAGSSTGTGAVPRGYAVIIGVAKYRNLDESLNLQFPETDADAVYRVLISLEGGAFPAENVHVLKGSQATLENVRQELEGWLPSVARPDDRVIVYFSGHGFIKRGRGYLATWDVDPEHPETTGYPMDTVGDVMANRVVAHWKVLLTDACHTGKINAETTNATVDAQFRNLPKSFLTFTAANSHDQSYEYARLSTGFGVFTYFLVEGLKGFADNDPCDGIVTAHELVEYVRSNVVRYTRDLGRFQTPETSGDFEPTMVLGMSRRCGVGPLPVSGTLVVEGNMDGIQVYLENTNNLKGELSANKTLRLPLPAGPHTVIGVRSGYESDQKEVMVIPGEEITVTLRMRYLRRIRKTALDLNAAGEKLLYSHRSTVDPRNDLPLPRSQRESDLKKARTLFEAAVREEQAFSRAEFNLGQVNQLLADEKASIASYRRAIEIDPDYFDARVQYSAVLIENGDADEAIRQLTEALRLSSNSDEAYSLIARAYLDKGVWDRCGDFAGRALTIRPSNDQAHLWKADCLRNDASKIPLADRSRWLIPFQSAEENYREYLRLTDFTTPGYQSVAFHLIGFGTGARVHPDRKAAYDNQRSDAFQGLCICNRRMGNLLAARDSCEQALKHTPDSPMAHYVTGDAYLALFRENTDRCDYLLAAREHYTRMVKLNSEIKEAANARTYLERIGETLRDPRLKGCRGRS